MEWKRLLSSQRLGKEGQPQASEECRSVFQRDYDRLIFSAPFRRMQNKTQVFPLPGSVFVHNRLTHSLEVSSVGRSLGNDVAAALARKHCDADALASMGTIISTACLAHDMGNPPFGHSGEEAIRTYFTEGAGQALRAQLHNEAVWDDITRFDGNANTFRLLTHQFCGRRRGGFVMTYSVLAAVGKYPWSSSLAPSCKFGFFASEKEAFCRIAKALGVPLLEERGEAVRFARYPLVYLVEAADDICYEVMDIEDAFKLRLLSAGETKELFLSFFTPEQRVALVAAYDACTDDNDRIAYYRSCVISALEHACVEVFVANEEKLLAGEDIGALVKYLPGQLAEGFRLCEKVAKERIYHCREVSNVELGGYHIIYTLLDLMTSAVLSPQKAYSQLLLKQASKQYELGAASLDVALMGVLDYVSGMTDVYALDLYRKVNGHSLPSV